MSVLVIAEAFEEKLTQGTYAAIQAADRFNAGITVLVLGSEMLATQAACVAKAVVWIDDPALAQALPDCIAAALIQVAGAYDTIVAASSTFSKNFLPRVADHFDVQLISDVIEILDAATFKRPIYAGNAIETIQSQDDKKIITISATAFEPAARVAQVAPIQKKTVHLEASSMQCLGIISAPSERPDLSCARVVVSGGRGLKNAENFKLIYDLADTLHAAVGASRAAVDAGFIANEHQVGQTGKVVAPELYIAVGISGAIQHTAGMKDSKVIVAINSDPNAPIFQIADYGLVGDLFEVLPELIEQLR